MEIFEFHINPNNKKNYCERFIFNPPAFFDKFGSIYIIVELKNPLSSKPTIVNGLIKIFKENYYLNSKENHKKAFEKAIIKVNEYLKDEISKNNTSWLGNLNCTIFTLNQYDILLTKSGNINVLLFQENRILNIGDNSSSTSDQKFFKNIIEGKIDGNSKMVIITKNLLSVLNEKISFFDIIRKKETEIEKILRKQKKNIGSISGIIFILSKKIIRKKKITKEEHFSLKIIFSPFLRLIQTIQEKMQKKKKKRKPTSRKKQNINDSPFIFKITEKTKKDLILVFLFIFFLSLGFLLFQKNEQPDPILNEIDEAIDFSFSLIAIGKNEEALNELQKIWEQIIKLPPSSDVDRRRALIEEKLKTLTKMKIIESPEVVIDLRNIQIVPQGMISQGTKILFFTSFSKIITELNLKTLEVVECDSPETISAATIMNNKFILFSRPNKIFSFSNGNFAEIGIIETQEDTFHGIAYFNNKFYFWDPESGEILVSPSNNLSSFSAWLNEGAKKTTDVRSMSVDGSVWTLSGNNNISRYSEGLHQKSFSPNLFPAAKKLSRIKAYPFSSYLYLADSSNKRIIILDKGGKVIQQLQSEKFENIIDFLVLPNGKIYVLSDLILYSI